MRYVGGQLYLGNGFVEGYIGFEDGMVKEVGEGSMEGAEMTGIILPTFVNAHTHLADLRVPVDLNLPLEDLVAPPHGLKHRYLAQASDAEVRGSFDLLSRKMVRNGTSRFVDFREGGVEGARLLKGVGSGGGAKPFIMGRPKGLNYVKEEIDQLLETADGVGVSSISDWDYEELRSLARHVRGKGRPFALHASERVREDIDKVLDLGPAFLVHMTHASLSDLEACRDADVPIVVCPRSNLFFGSIPPLGDMVRSGVTLALGTDNAMIALPDMLTEIEFAARIMRGQGVRHLEPVLNMVIAGGRLILNEMYNIGMKTGSPCDFMVLRSKKGDPVTDVALRSNERDVRLVCVGRYSWRGWR